MLRRDVGLYKDGNGKDKYCIENAWIEYYKQSLLLESDYDSVYIASIDGRKDNGYKE